MKRALALFIAIIALPARAADFSRAAIGTTGSEFLLFDTSARGVAMGGAFSSVTNDASSLYWNPAGLARVPRFSASFLHALYVADITYNAAAVARRVNETSVVGAGVRYLDIGEIDQTNISGVTTGSFRPRSYVAELGWGQAIYDLSDSETDVLMGVSAKYLHTDMTARADAFAGDFGVQSHFYGGRHNYDVSLAIQNVGAGQKFESTRDSLPTRIRFGGAVRPLTGLLLSAEGLLPINNAPYAAAGAEYELNVDRQIKGALRAGVSTFSYDSLGAASMFSFGFGLTFSHLGIDYAFAPSGVLGSHTHRLSINFNLPAKTSRRYRER